MYFYRKVLPNSGKFISLLLDSTNRKLCLGFYKLRLIDNLFFANHFLIIKVKFVTIMNYIL